jgi:hypothetical protein
VRTLLGEELAPITTSIGYLRLPLDRAVSGLVEWRKDLYGGRVKSTTLRGDLRSLLRRLEPLTFGYQPREIMVRAGSEWTAYFNSSALGSDPASPLGHLTRTLKCDGLVIHVAPHILRRPDGETPRLGSVQFLMLGPDETHWLNYVRSVYVHFESKWEFRATGTPQWFEDTGAYSAPRIRDRFTSEMLERYCRALGLEVFDASQYGPDAVLVESDVPKPDPAPPLLSLAEAQKRKGIVPGMADRLRG